AHGLDLRVCTVLGAEIRPEPPADLGVAGAAGIQANLVTLLEGPALETAEAADGDGRAASHVLGNVERSADRDVRPEARALEHLHLEQACPSLLWNRDLLHRLGLSALEGGNLGLDRLEEFQI